MLSDIICVPQNEKDENIISISPETTIVKTTLPIPKTTIPIIKTTVPEDKITNLPTNDKQIATNSLIIESPMKDTTIKNIMTTTLDIEKNKITESIPIEQITTAYPDNKNTEIIKKTDFPIESLCEKNKIYSEGKCICNTEKGYYSINYKSSEKCYKKTELPKNIYFNNITKSYKLCYKSYETCS